MHKIKILFIHHSGMMGGAPRSLKFILERIVNDDHFDTNLLMIRDGVVNEFLNVPGVGRMIGEGLYPFHGSTVSGRSLKMFLINFKGLASTYKNIGLYIKSDYDVIYLNSTCLAFYAWYVKRKDKKVKIICHVREPILRNSISGYIIKKVCNKYCDRFIAISNYDAQSLNAASDKIKVVHNYIDTTEYSNNDEKKQERADLIIGYFARFDAKNGILEFLKLAKMLEEFPEIQFHAYGLSGQEKSIVTKAIETKSANLHIYPMTNDVILALKSLDILLVPFLEPHFSRSVIEAAALKVPSIIYNVGSVNEEVIDGETGYVVNPTDLHSMAEKIHYLKEHREVLRDMGENARQFVLDEFSEKNYERIKNYILEVI